jgi:hypothetical protein
MAAKNIVGNSGDNGTVHASETSAPEHKLNAGTAGSGHAPILLLLLQLNYISIRTVV